MRLFHNHIVYLWDIAEAAAEKKLQKRANSPE